MEQPSAYQGDNGYIFVSYCRKDLLQAWPIIVRMYQDGYRIWFVEENQPTTQWNEEVAQHVAECGYFVALLSRNYLASESCKDELSYARDQVKPQLLIYLEDVALPRGMAMRMGRNQAVFYNRYLDKEAFFEKLYEAPDLHFYLRDNAAPKLAKPRKRRRQGSLGKIIGATLAVLLIAGAAGMGAYLAQREQLQSQETTQNTLPPDLTPEINSILLDNDQLKITHLGTQVQADTLYWELSVTNKTKSDIILNLSDIFLNGVSCAADWSGFLNAGQTGKIQLKCDAQQLEPYGVRLEQLSVLQGQCSGQFRDGSGYVDKAGFVCYPYGREYAQYGRYTPAASDLTVLQEEGFTAYLCGSGYDQSTNAWVQTFVFENHSAENVNFTLTGVQVNGYQVPVSGVATVAPKCTLRKQISVAEQDWQDTDYPQVYRSQSQVLVYNAQSYQREASAVTSEPFILYPEGEAKAQRLQPRQLTQDQILAEGDAFQTGYLGMKNFSGWYYLQFYAINRSQESCAVTISFYEEPEALSEVLNPLKVVLQPGAQCILSLSQDDIFARMGNTPQQLHLRITAKTESMAEESRTSCEISVDP